MPRKTDCLPDAMPAGMAKSVMTRHAHGDIICAHASYRHLRRSSATDSGAGSDGEPSGDVTKPADTGNDGPSADVKVASYRVGDTLTIEDMEIAYVASGPYTGEYIGKEDGYDYIFLEFCAKNVGDKPKAVATLTMEPFADGYSGEVTLLGTLGGTITPGRAIRGTVVFKIEEGATEVSIEYEPNFLTGEKVIFVYEGEKSADVTTGPARIATDGAVAEGSVFENDGVKITFLSSGDIDTSTSWSGPAEGNKAIYCEFEVENKANGELSVSSFDFDCYADGMLCDSYYTGDSVSGTLEKGQKAKGKVGFEIPEDADVIEIEYVYEVDWEYVETAVFTLG